MRDRIAATAGAISRLSTRQSEAKRARDFQNRADALRKPAERLEGLCRKYRLLTSHGVDVPLKPDTPRSLLGQLAELRQRFEADAESILAGDPKRAGSFWRPLDAYPDQVENDLQKAWKDWVFESLPGGEQELLDVLDKFPSFREPVQVIRNGLTEAGRLAAQVPVTDGPFAAVAQLADPVAQAWNRLHGAQVSPEVLTFLKKAAVREATLADYTPDVMKWVQENGLVRAFLITVGGK